MASILRSSKFVRYIAGFARNIVVNSPREFDGNFFNTTQCLCGAIPRSFATEASAQHDQSLDKRLRTLDQDVRRSGRISRRDIEDVLEEIRQTRSATSSQSLLVIRCCGNLVPEEMPEIRTKLVQEIWNTLKRLNVPMDISHYNALLRVYLENEHQFSPTDFLADLESKGIEPNRVTYQRLIARYCQTGDIDGATRILEFMKEKQLPVNENVFNALINGHSQTGDMDSAQGILAVMAQAGLEPSADTYTTLICGFAKQGDIEKIEKLMSECEEKEILLLDKDLLEIAYSLAINGHNDHIPKILGETKKQFGYNQDAINVILRLVNKKADKGAYLVLKSMTRVTREDGSYQPSGHFFLKQMVKNRYPINEILEYCNKLQEDGLYEKGLLHATESALQLGYDDLAVTLFDELQKAGLQIRQHYFWPLLRAKANESGGDEGIIKVLSDMNKYNINPSQETIRDYVLPYLSGKSSDIIAKLRMANVSIGAAGASLVHSLIMKGDLTEAAVIMSKVSAYYYPENIRKPLMQAFYKSNDLKSYITIIRCLYENHERREVVGENTENIDKSELVGKLLWDLTSPLNSFLKVAENVLSALVEQGLSISAITAQKIEDKLGEKMTPEISTLLGKLSSGELTPIEINKKSPTYTPANMMNIPQLERLIHNLEAKQQDTKGLKRQLLSLYYRAKELDKMVALISGLEKDNFVFTAGVYAQLADTYVVHDKLDEALEVHKKINEMEPNFVMDESKVIRLIALYIKKNRFDEAIELINTSPPRKSTEEHNFSYNSMCWRLLNSLAEEGRDKDLETLFNALLEKEYFEVSNILLGPLIKVQLVKNDINKALEIFEHCCNQYKATPWKNELTCKLIQLEDAEKLQKLTDLSTLVHGEINSLYDLVFSFVECGRTRQARKILETPGLQSRPNRINSVCQRYQLEGLVKPLEGLKDATKDLNHIDRSNIYYQLLLSYIKQDDANKAMGLWTQMQEEDMAPSDEFLRKLGQYLVQKNMVVPFVIPEEVQQQQQQQVNVNSFSKSKAKQRNINEAMVMQENTKKDVQLLRQALKNNDLETATRIQQATKENIPSNDLSILIERLIQNDRIQEATRLSMNMLDSGSIPITRVFRFLLNKLANAGDVESLEQIGKKVSSEMKKLISFDNRICHANLIRGNASQYLDLLEKEIDEAPADQIQHIGEKFPRGGAVGILERHPELEEKYKSIAIKYAKKGIVSPVNVLWAHYFVSGRLDIAEKLWNDHLQGAQRIMFQRVVQHARESKDEIMTEKLIEHLKMSKVTEGAIGNAYSCLLDVLVAKEKNDEVVKAFEKAVKDVSLEHINRTAVIRVKETYEKLGKEFTYKIPPKTNNRNLQSSSEEFEFKK